MGHMWAAGVCRQAAQKGDVKAMAHLGHMYANGAGGVAANNDTALAWFLKAAEHNQPSALYGLGYLHLAGYGVHKNYKKAFHYFEQAAQAVLNPSTPLPMRCTARPCTAQFWCLQELLQKGLPLLRACCSSGA
jgi:Sel1 repeat